jgi:hypothetical protein
MVVISEGRNTERPKYAGSAMAQLEADKKHLEAKIAVLEVQEDLLLHFICAQDSEKSIFLL